MIFLEIFTKRLTCYLEECVYVWAHACVYLYIIHLYIMYTYVVYFFRIYNSKENRLSLPTYSFVKDNFSNMNLLMLISWEGIRIHVACYACGG